MLPGYLVARLRAGYELTPALSLLASVDNLTDKAYEQASGYRAAGREYFLRLRWMGRVSENWPSRLRMGILLPVTMAWRAGCAPPRETRRPP